MCRPRRLSSCLPRQVDRIDPRVVEDRIGYFAVWARKGRPAGRGWTTIINKPTATSAPAADASAPTFLVFANFFPLVAYWGETALSPAAVLHNALTRKRR